MLLRLVITFLSRSKHLLISWLHSPSAVILEPWKIVSHCFHCFPFYLPWSDGTGEKAMAPHSSTLAWKIPWMEEPGRLQSMGSLRVGHDWETLLSLFTFLHWRRKWQPTTVFLPGESQGQGSLVAAVYGVTQSRTQLKWLSSSRWDWMPWS